VAMASTGQYINDLYLIHSFVLSGVAVGRWQSTASAETYEA